MSSTFEDLREERALVMEALLEQDCFPGGGRSLADSGVGGCNRAETFVELRTAIEEFAVFGFVDVRGSFS
ncbi:MAG: hypothetical protein FJW38_14185 [Acidobacteria bacterium]|nr:hypothetical protein [Acidobacteriota bacterium]